MKKFKKLFEPFNGVLLGAAFLMANSSIGPGFLTQTTVFTQKLMASFGFVIIVSSLIDIGAQLNAWRIIAITELRAQDLANKILPGTGYFLSLLIVLGGFAFNIGNIAGCGLAGNVLFEMSFEQGAIISGIAALILFWVKEIGKMIDNFAKILGVLKIALTLFIAYNAHPPLATAITHTFLPNEISSIAIVTIVGGTVGGYLMFSGAHRLLDAGVVGEKRIKEVNKSAVSGIIISGLMRFILFLAAFGVLSQGALLDESNPPASVFEFAAGNIGLKIFGIVLWSAALSSVVGAAYTSVSFFKTFHPLFEKYERVCISIFILISTAIFVGIGKPVKLLLAAGAINGLVLPIALAFILVAARNKIVMKGYNYPVWMLVTGWIVVVIMGWMCIQAFKDFLAL
ncbi:MAG: divalent metal cation transporter [Limnohabitans sp.]|nr:divalent metal cation transporter [Limnohabitans sp.]